MKIATNVKPLGFFGYQLIFNEELMVIGVNVLHGRKILRRERFKRPCWVKGIADEERLVYKTIEELLKNK